MLQIPQKGIKIPCTAESVSVHALADWIEASLLFSGNFMLSKSEVSDTLIEQYVCEDQDVANELADIGWIEIQKRISMVGSSSPFSIDELQLKIGDEWEGYPAYSLLLALSLLEIYTDWAKETANYVRQGKLFEDFCVAALTQLFSGWTIQPTGWSPETPDSIDTLIDLLLDLIPTQRGLPPIKVGAENWKDGGLDIVCVKNFPDRRHGSFLFMVQCASGKHWEIKLGQPKMSIINQMAMHPFMPTRIVTIPFCVPDEKLWSASSEAGGPLLDRTRLLSAGNDNTQWLDEKLRSDIIEWLRPRIALLPPA